MTVGGAPTLFGYSLDWVQGVAGPVWMVLSGMMATAAWLLFRDGTDTARRHAWLVLGLLALCWLHPLYTAWFDALGWRHQSGLVGALLTLLVASFVISQVVRTVPGVVLLLAPVLIWLAMASVYTALLIRQQPTV